MLGLQRLHACRLRPSQADKIDKRLGYVVALALAGLAVLTPAALAATWRWPVRGPVIERFFYGPNPFARGQHRGIDIAAPAGTPVVAACPGRVRFAGAVGAAGRTVSVTCGRFVATYLHLDAIAVRRGARLSRGDPVGTVGTTGRPRNARPHLQFGVRRAARRWAYVDPLRLLPGGEVAPPDAVPAARAGRRPPTPAAERAPPVVPSPAPAPAPVPADLGRAPAPRTDPADRAPAVAGHGPAHRRPATTQHRRHPALGLPLGSLWLPLGAALALVAVAAPLTALRIRRRDRRRTGRHSLPAPARRLT